MNHKITTLFTVIVISSSALSTHNAIANMHDKAVTKKASPKPTAVDLDQGKALIAKSDCLSCHRLDIKLVGPAYKDVADKYPQNKYNYNALTQKVIAGGSGVWGQVAMAAHPNLAAADDKKMVEYILTVK